MSLVCPISDKIVDSNISRLTVFLNVLLMGIFLYTHIPLVIIIVTIDYAIRAFWNTENSPACFTAKHLVRFLNISPKPIDLAPKIFAARLGFLCALTATIFILLNYTTASLVVTTLLITLSTLDSVFNFCLGCWIYAYIVIPFNSHHT